jgi:hypothetical protein
MDFIADWLFEAVLANVLDPVVFGTAAVLSVALCSGLVASAIEAAEERLPVRMSRPRSIARLERSARTLRVGLSQSTRREVIAQNA